MSRPKTFRVAKAILFACAILAPAFNRFVEAGIRPTYFSGSIYVEVRDPSTGISQSGSGQLVFPDVSLIELNLEEPQGASQSVSGRAKSEAGPLISDLSIMGRAGVSLDHRNCCNGVQGAYGNVHADTVIEFEMPSDSMVFDASMGAGPVGSDPVQVFRHGHFLLENVSQGIIILEKSDVSFFRHRVALPGTKGDLVRVNIEVYADVTFPQFIEDVDSGGSFRIHNSGDCNNNGVPDYEDGWDNDGYGGDCNHNSTLDECDIASGVSLDCDGDLLPDECEEADCNENGHPDECDILELTSEDCNENAVPDECDIADGLSVDCNENGIPDDCDLESGSSGDCNFDSIPDDCQPDEDCNDNGITDLCDIGSATSPDCNANLSPDECDILFGTSLDVDSDGIPNECEILVSTWDDRCDGGVRDGLACTAHVDCPAGLCHNKNRFLSFNPQWLAAPYVITTLQVRVVDIPSSLPALQTLMEGDAWWVGAPVDLLDVSSPNGVVRAAPLECVAIPHARAWGQNGPVHVFGAAIVPGATYAVRHCSQFGEECSPWRTITTARFGDIDEPVSMGPTTFRDITAVVQTFGGASPVSDRLRGSLRGNIPMWPFGPNFEDISEAVAAFRGGVYRYAGASCP